MARRPLTEIELRLVARITDLFLTDLEMAWANIARTGLRSGTGGKQPATGSNRSAQRSRRADQLRIDAWAIFAA